MTGTGPVIHIEPLVRWPKTMARSEPHLVEVDLRLADDQAAWPYEDEEFSFRVLLAGKPFYLVETVDDSCVTVHRFGGSYGPCRFVVTPEGELGEYPLGLSLETEGGVPVMTTALPVRVAESAVLTMAAVEFTAPGDGDGGMRSAPRIDLDRIQELRDTAAPQPSTVKRVADAYLRFADVAMEIFAPRSAHDIAPPNELIDTWRSVFGDLLCGDWLRDERANLEFVAILAGSVGLRPEMERLSELMHRYHRTRRSWSADVEFQSRLAEVVAPDASTRIQARKCESLRENGRKLEASTCYASVISILRRRLDGDPAPADLLELAAVLTNSGMLRSELGHASEAGRWFDEALSIHQQLIADARAGSDRVTEANALTGIGNTYALMGRYDRAWTHLTNARALFDRMGDQGGTAQVTEMLDEVNDSLIEADRNGPPASDVPGLPGDGAEPASVAARHEAAMTRVRSSDPTQQLTGFAALASLAHETAEPQLRQEIADTMCGFIRAHGSARDESGPGDEISGAEVCETVLNLLTQLLRDRVDDTVDEPTASPSTPRGTQPLNVDLTGATLPFADFSGCHFGDTWFDEVAFTEATSFQDARFTGELHAEGAEFRGEARFVSMRFHGETWFDNTVFAGPVIFRRTAFFRDTSLKFVTFRERVEFEDCRIFGRVSFQYSTIDGGAEFARVELADTGYLDLDSLRFGDFAASIALPPEWRLDQPEHGDATVVTASGSTGGAEQSLSALVSEHSPTLWRLARAAGLSRQDAEDLVQSVWLRYLRHRDDIAAKDTAGWLITTTRRETWRLSQEHARTVPESPSWIQRRIDDAEALDDMSDVLDKIDSRQRQRALWLAIGSLSQRHQWIIKTVLRSDDPRVGYENLADLLRMPRGAIGQTRGRALDELRQRLLADPEWARRLSDSDD